MKKNEKKAQTFKIKKQVQIGFTENIILGGVDGEERVLLYVM